jgi:hypothetical protein
VVDEGPVYRKGTVYVTSGAGGEQGEPDLPAAPDWLAASHPLATSLLRVEVDPKRGDGTRRMTLGQYRASDGAPLEEGVVIERRAHR